MSKAPVVQAVEMTVKWTDGSEHQAHLFETSGSWTWQQGGSELSQADLAEREFGDTLTAFAEAVAEYNANHTPAFHLHVGANIPGYLPQGEPTCMGDDVDGARNRLIEELSLAQDGLPDCEFPPEDGTPCGREECGGCTGHADIETATMELKSGMDVSEGVLYDVNDGRSLPVRYWIDVVPAGDCELDDD